VRALTALVLSAGAADAAGPRVGFFGRGGIGKTVPFFCCWPTSLAKTSSFFLLFFKKD
jgi:hypothetical protein